MHLLEPQHLKKYFATQKAVDDISMQLSEGSIWSSWPQRCGKRPPCSEMITGIFYPDSGDTPEWKKFNPVNDVRSIGYMPEERGLYKK